VLLFPVLCSSQETEIDSIHQLVVGATENVKEGNEDIREVMEGYAKQPQ
jgi:syntaxin 18